MLPTRRVVDTGDVDSGRGARMRRTRETVRSLHRGQTLGCGGQPEDEAFELLQMERREVLESLGSDAGQLQAHDAMVLGVATADDQTGLVGTVHQLDGAVMAQEQVVRHLADGRAAWVVVTANGEEELVLARREPCGPGLLLTPTQEVPESRPQRGAVARSRYPTVSSGYDNIAIRWIFGLIAGRRSSLSETSR